MHLFRLRLALGFLFALFSSLFCVAQETRTDVIERERERKAAHLQPYQPAKVEKALSFLDDHKVLERLTDGYHGWNLRFGGLVQGSGFALGPEFTLGSNSSPGNLRVGAPISTKLYQKYLCAGQCRGWLRIISLLISMRRTGTIHRSTILAQAPDRRRATDGLQA